MHAVKMMNIVKFGQRFSPQCRHIFSYDVNKLPHKRAEQLTHFHKSACYQSTKDDDSNTTDATKIKPGVSTRYELFTDDKTSVILDIEEERDKLLAGELEIEHVEDAVPNTYAGLNTERGINGVFDIEDLITVLKRDNAENIFVCTVPKHLKYVDHLVVVTARSHRHMKALAEFVRKMFKIKRKKNDTLPKIEGINSDEWIAMDLGNIALHIFSAKVRKQYDLEMLWSVGPDFDTETNKPDDPIVELFDQHSFAFSKLKSNNNELKDVKPNDLENK